MIDTVRSVFATGTTLAACVAFFAAILAASHAGLLPEAFTLMTALATGALLVVLHQFVGGLVGPDEPETMIHSTVQALWNTTDDGLLVVDGNGVLRSVNPAASAMFGFRTAELHTAHASTLLPIAGLDAEEALMAFHQGDVLSGCHKDGSAVPLQIFVSPFEDKGERLFGVTLRSAKRHFSPTPETMYL